MHTHRCQLVIATMLAGSALASCASAPRARPLPTGSSEQGPNSTTAVRKQFEGTWSLVSLRITAPDGRQVDPEATGDLTFDGFGVLQVVYQVTPAAQKRLAEVGVKMDTPRISTTGRVVIDTQQN